MSIVRIVLCAAVLLFIAFGAIAENVTEGDVGTTFGHVFICFDVPFIPYGAGYRIVGANATPNVDFVAVESTYWVSPRVCPGIVVTVINDTVPEPLETVVIQQTSPVFRTMGVLNIIDNDSVAAAAQITSSRVIEGHGDTSSVVVPITLNRTVTGDANVVVTAHGTASGDDYLPFAQTTLSFTGGKTQQSVTLRILGDRRPEPDETIVLTVVSGTLKIPTVSATVTIANDDVAITPSSLRVPVDESSSIRIDLGQAAATPQTIRLRSSVPGVLRLPATLVVPAGTRNVRIKATGASVGSALVEVELPAAFGGQTERLRAIVYAETELSFAPPSLRIPSGGTASIVFDVRTAGSDAVLLDLQTDATLLTVPRSIAVTPGEPVRIDVTALRPGFTTIRATLPATHGGFTHVLLVDVIDPGVLPFITRITPARGPAAGGTSVELSGVNLRADCTVSFAGLAAVSTYGSPNTITATTPAHAAGPVAVAVQCGADAFSFEEGFEYLPD